MLLFGHPHVPSEKLYHVSSIEAIAHTPSNACLLFNYDQQVFELIAKRRLALQMEVTALEAQQGILAESGIGSAPARAYAATFSSVMPPV